MLVSVITPTYNREKFLDETISSVLNQDYPNIEYIVIDDGSKDNTKSIIQKYLPQLKYYYHDNIGETKTVNKAYNLSKGEITLIVNSDDPLYSPNVISSAIKLFQNDPEVLAVYSDWVSIDEKGNELDHVILPEYNIENMLFDFNVCLGPGMFIKRSALEKIGFRNEKIKYTGDLNLSFKLAKLGKIKHLSQFGATHRKHNEALSTIEKGLEMSNEIFNLAIDSFESPNGLTQRCIDNKRNILKRAALVSTSFLSNQETSLEIFTLMLKKINSVCDNSLNSILQINETDLMSRRFGGYDLNYDLRQKGFHCEQLVWNNQSKEIHTSLISEKINNEIALKNISDQLNYLFGSNSLFYPFSYGLLFNEKFLNCDIVHMHLIHNYFFGIEHLPIISKIKPVVWTLHDPWAITGHCVHPLDCERWIEGCWNCPDTARAFKIPFDTSALNWEYKKNIFQSCDLDIIVSSKWMFEKISKSSFFKNAQLHLINFGLDLNLFRPIDSKIIKQKFKIPEQNIVVAFRATEWIYKGLNYIRECLRTLSSSKNITLLVFNDKGLLKEFENQYQVIELGWLDNDNTIIEAYNAADIFLMPSIAESFGMMAMEAMACGKPVVVMDGSAISEVVRPDETGCIVVPQGNVNEMRIQLEKLINNKDLRIEIGKKSRLAVEKYYNKDRYINDTIRVYQMALDRKKDNFKAAYIIEQQKVNSLLYKNNILFYNHLYFEKLYAKFITHKIIKKLLKTKIVKFLAKKFVVPFLRTIYNIIRNKKLKIN